MSEYQESRELFISRNILLKRLEGLQYDVLPYINASIQEVNIMKETEQLDMMIHCKYKNPDYDYASKLYVHYLMGKSLRPDNIYAVMNDLCETEGLLNPGDTILIVTNITDKLSDNIKQTLTKIWHTDYESNQIYITIDTVTALQFDVLKHESVPPHTHINNKEKVDAIMKKYNSTDTKDFPKISRFDPVAKAILLRPGQMCEIIRSSPVAIDSIYYRVCENKF